MVCHPGATYLQMMLQRMGCGMVEVMMVLLGLPQPVEMAPDLEEQEMRKQQSMQQQSSSQQQ